MFPLVCGTLFSFFLSFFMRESPSLHKLYTLSFMWPGRLSESVESLQFKHVYCTPREIKEPWYIVKTEVITSSSWKICKSDECCWLGFEVPCMLSSTIIFLGLGQHCIIITFNTNINCKYSAGQHISQVLVHTSSHHGLLTSKDKIFFEFESFLSVLHPGNLLG